MKRLVTPRFLHFYAIALLLATSFPATAQEDSIKSKYQKEFDDFLNASQQAFNSFKSKNDSLFHQFLLSNWKEYELMRDAPLIIPKPKEQPRMKSRNRQKINEIQTLPRRKTILEDTGRQMQLQSVPKGYHSMKEAPNYSTVSFYGTNIKVPTIGSLKLLNEGELSKKQIAGFFQENADNNKLITAVNQLSRQAQERGLNAWGYLRLLQEASAVYYTGQNERVLFTWLALIKSGYDAIIGYNADDIFLLVNFDTAVYYASYFEKNGRKYYLTLLSGQSDSQKPIASYQGEYPATLVPVSLHIQKNPLFASNQNTREIHYKDQLIQIHYNQNIVDFYNNYPVCALSIYFPPPLSQAALKSLDSYFDTIFQGKTNTGRVKILLDFVQTGFPYETDEQQFGKENYLFAEETIFNKFSDCEDRAILLGQLIQHFTGLKAIGLVFPGHVSLAVNIPETIEGSYINHNNSKYYICDPTYIGSKLGMMMPEFEKNQPK
jgi:hypothetical protein